MAMSSGATASHTTENAGVTIEATLVETNGNGPTWHKRQQWSCEWCCSLAETKPADCAARKRHTKSNTHGYRFVPLARNVTWITVYRPLRSSASAPRIARPIGAAILEGPREISAGYLSLSLLNVYLHRVRGHHLPGGRRTTGAIADRTDGIPDPASKCGRTTLT